MSSSSSIVDIKRVFNSNLVQQHTSKNTRNKRKTPTNNLIHTLL